jgi:hypothetical protein
MADEGTEEDKGYDADLDVVVAKVDVEGTKLMLHAKSYDDGDIKIAIVRQGPKKVYPVKRIPLTDAKAIGEALVAAFEKGGAFAKLKNKAKEA